MPLDDWAGFDAACAKVCAHCAGGNPARFRPETNEWCHDFAATGKAIDTPSLFLLGGPVRMMPGTFAHTFCSATKIRNEKLQQ